MFIEIWWQGTVCKFYINENEGLDHLLTILGPKTD